MSLTPHIQCFMNSNSAVDRWSNAYMQWLNYSTRGSASLQARGLKGREQRWGSRPPTRGFRAFKALCLASMAFDKMNSVWRWQHWQMQMTKWPWRITFSLQNIMHREKYSNINSAEWWNPARKVPDLNCEVQDLLLEVVDLKQEAPDLRSGGIPPI